MAAEVTEDELRELKIRYNTVYGYLKLKTIRINDSPTIALSNILPNLPPGCENTPPSPGPPNTDHLRWLLHYLNNKMVVMESVSVPPAFNWEGASCSRGNALNMQLWHVYLARDGTDDQDMKDSAGYWSYWLAALEFPIKSPFHNDHQFPRLGNIKYPLWIGEHERGQYELIPKETQPGELVWNAVLFSGDDLRDNDIPGYRYRTDKSFYNVWSWPGDGNITINSLLSNQFERIRSATSRTAARTLRRLCTGHLRLHTPQRREMRLLLSKTGSWKYWATVLEEVWENLPPESVGLYAKRYKVISGYDDTCIWWQFDDESTFAWGLFRDQNRDESWHNRAEEERKIYKRNIRKARQYHQRHAPLCRSRHQFEMYLKDAEELHAPRGNEFEVKIPVGSKWLFDEVRQQVFEIVEKETQNTSTKPPARNPPSSSQLINQAFHDSGFETAFYRGFEITRTLPRTSVVEEGDLKWVFLKVLSPPPGNKVTLWGGLDHTGKIKDRLVMKQLAYSDGDHTRHPDPTQREAKKDELWYSWYLSFTVKDQRPPIIEFRGWAVRKAENLLEQRYRLFLEYAEGGDLYSFIETHARQRKHIPEGFIWKVLKNLINACLWLQKHNFVHLDITPKNILLTRNHPHGRYMKHYRPVLADFSCMIDSKTTHNLVPQNRGTPGWMSPEMIEATFGNTPQPADKIHVLSIGLVIWSLLRRNKDGLLQRLTQPRQADFLRTLPTTTIPANTPADINLVDDSEKDDSPYSQGLEDLVDRCLNYDSQQRPSLEVLQRDLETAMEEFGRMGQSFSNFQLGNQFNEQLVSKQDAAEA
ncbi:kinase-like protein [Periconia macrospinosa]|uniref:EKC/KEOPS complex subunit BUD32 n=1 Tax=Periconia macrospinosa TaxID=97972 RepID=A0A2V1EE86_9PLEO|nr:kinase-like protein [Periconia macrospinosa]